MKNPFLLILIFLISAVSIAQNGINYKALIKDANDDVVANQAITIQFQILEDGTTNVYQETHNPTTDANGIAIVNIGEGTVISGDFSIIDWGAVDHFLNVQMDTGAGLVDLGTTQFKSVPYALMAETAKDAPFKKIGDVVRHADESDFLFGAAAQDYTSNVGTETKFFFNADTQAFRGGKIANENWDAVNLGDYSFAYGLFNKVTGDGSVSFGINNDVGGARAFAHGSSNVLTDFGSVAFGASNNLSGVLNLTVGLENTSAYDYTSQLGLKLVSGRAFQTILGEYNTVSSTALFQIGNGDFNTTNTLFSIEDDGAIISDFYEGTGERLIAADTNGKLIESTLVIPSPSSGLEKITENGKSGYRIAGKDPTLYGNIGSEAVDLSYNATVSPFYGARGDYSFSAGFEARASGDNSVAFSGSAIGNNSVAIGDSSIASRESAVGMGGGRALGAYSFAMGASASTNAAYSTSFGRHNVNNGDSDNWVATDPLFELGNGTSENAKSNALTVLKNGTITAPSFEIAEITDSKALITKEYLEASSAMGLEKITEGSNTGFRFIGKDPTQFGDIGQDGVDISVFSSGTPETYGATGNRSFAGGLNVLASGSSSIAYGAYATAAGNSSFAFGNFTDAEGNYSFASGEFVTASAENSTAFGKSNVGGGDPVNWVATDPLFEIGNGTNSAAKSNALTVLKNGKVGIGKHTDLGGMLEIQSNSTATQPQLTLIEDNASFARIKFKNTNRNGDDYWDIAGFIGATQADDRLNFFNSDGGDIMSIEGDGDVRVNGSVVHASDRRLKSDIEAIDFGIAEILKLNPVQYNWKDKEDKSYKSLGVIAQEIQEIIPNVVQKGNDEHQTLSVSYTELIPVLIKAIQEQQNIIIAQETKIASQDEQYASLEKIVQALAIKVEEVLDTSVAAKR